MLQAKLDEWGKPAWFALLLIGFAAGWPFGLAVLAYLVGSGRLKAWRNEMPGAWSNLRGPRFGCGWARWSGSSGNRAFDDYRAETLRRLEEEQKEFEAFLEQLRQARDKAEFDQFMAGRKRRDAEPQAEA